VVISFSIKMHKSVHSRSHSLADSSVA
jgi:hypothetical protein